MKGKAAMKDYARAFYKSAAWQRVSRAYMQRHNWICERCGKPAVICHHKQHLNPGNIRDALITLNPDNLEALCQECHNREHFAEHGATVFDAGLKFDSNGNLIRTGEARHLPPYSGNQRPSGTGGGR